MGVTAENVARRFGVRRQAQDEFAYRSHQRAIAAQKAGCFDGEILRVETTVFDETGSPRAVRVERDELPRATPTWPSSARSSRPSIPPAR